MNEATKKYQLTFLFAPTAGQEKIKAIIQKIGQWVSQQGGSLAQEKIPESIDQCRKFLAYPVKKYKEAFLFNLDLTLPIEKVNLLIQQLKNEQEIIRSLITVKETKTPKQGSNLLKDTPLQKISGYNVIDKVEPLPDLDKPLISQDKEKLEKAAIKQTEPETKKDKVKIEELDKKLEEILNQ